MKGGRRRLQHGFLLLWGGMWWEIPAALQRAEKHLPVSLEFSKTSAASFLHPTCLARGGWDRQQARWQPAKSPLYWDTSHSGACETNPKLYALGFAQGR